MGKVYIFDHPLIQHKLSLMRDIHTGAKEFRELLEEISMLMVYEVTRDLPTKEVEIETPLCKTKARHLSGKKVGIVPILRAGLGMVDGVAKLIPAARIGRCSRWNIIASCLPTAKAASFWFWTPCWLRAGAPRRPSRSSSSATASTSVWST